VVEFHEPGEGRPGEVLLVEYKRGRPKPGRDDAFHVQLCGQALCLEEMLGIQIRRGMIFFGQPRRRTQVLFDDVVRRRTARTI
jgi:CRISPR-associated exonuclease Cas4